MLGIKGGGHISGKNNSFQVRQVVFKCVKEFGQFLQCRKFVVFSRRKYQELLLLENGVALNPLRST